MFFSEQEISDLVKAWIAISFAFAIVLGGGLGGNLLSTFLFASLTVGIAFIGHELSHKYVAQRFGCWAEFRAFDIGLLIAVLMSFTGIVFAAPGAVLIGGMVSREQNGKIAVAGPLVNLIIALIFLVLRVLIPASLFNMPFKEPLLTYGVFINSWLAFFNLLPFWQLDGNKILAWKTDVWLGLILAAGFLAFVV